MEIGHSANAPAVTGEQALQGLCKSSTISRRTAQPRRVGSTN